MKKIFLIIFLGILAFLPLISSAAGLVPCGGQGEPACQFCHFFVLFRNVIDFLLTKIIPPLAVLMLAIGGFMYVFAYLSPGEALPGGGKGGPALLSQAKKLIISVIFGLLIIFAAWIIVNTFFQMIGVADWTGLRQGWWKIDCPTVGPTGNLPESPPESPTKIPTETPTEIPETPTDFEAAGYYKSVGLQNYDLILSSQLDSNFLAVQADVNLLPQEKVYLDKDYRELSDEELSNLKLAYQSARNLFGENYQNRLKQTSVFILDNESYKTIVKSYLDDELARGTINTEEYNKYLIEWQNSGYAMYDRQGDNIVMRGSWPEERGMEKAKIAQNPVEIFVHEYGHIVDENSQFSKSVEYKTIYDDSYAEYNKGWANPFVSEYARVGGVREDFAETVKAYYNSGGNPNLVTKDRIAQTYIQERFNYLEENGIVKRPEYP